MPEFVTMTVADGVAVVELDRPPLNLINTQLARELARAVRDAAACPDAYAVLVHGGGKIFSAGDDAEQARGFADQQALAADMQRALGCLATLPLPAVAAISGYAAGGGLEVGLGADHRVAGDNVKLALPQARAGLIPRGGGTQRLPALIGRAPASDLILTGRFVGADEARALGLVDEVTAPDEVYQTAWEWAAQFRGRDRTALAAAKAALAGDFATERAQAASLLSRHP